MLSSCMHLPLLPLLASNREKEMKAAFELSQDAVFKVEDFLRQNGLTTLRKSHRTASQDGSWVEKMLKRMKEQPLHGDAEG